MKTLYTFVALFLTVALCSGKPPAGYTITGNVTGFPDSTMIYLQNSTDENIDSARIVKNKFLLKGHLTETPEQFWLHTTIDNKFIYTNLLIGNEKIKVKGDISDFPFNVKITGSKTQDEYNEIIDLTKAYYTERNAAYDDRYKWSQEEVNQRRVEFLERIRAIDSCINTVTIEFIKSHLDTYAGTIYLGYNKESFSKDTLRIMYDQIPDEIKNSKYGRIIEVYLNEKISEIGDMCHDFEAFDKDGNTIKFHDLLNGKYILLDFTSAGCGPCMMAANELRMINIRYSDSLKVISFSCDAKKENWLYSLERDNVTWMSLWDGKGSLSETYIKYGVRGYPSFFLINPEGKIIDMWSGYGQNYIVGKLGKNNVLRNAPKP